MTPPVRFITRLPGLITGLGCIVLGIWILKEIAPPPNTLTYSIAVVLIGFGLVAVVLAYQLPRGRVFNSLQWISINLLVLIGLLGFIEAAGRTANIDFKRLAGKRAADPTDEYPIWGRRPTKPLDEAFYQRPGPATWTGQALRTIEIARKGTDNAYANDPIVTINYNADGFRNPPDLKDWDIVMAGDSFTEIGYLPYDQLTSTLLGKNTGLRVKNLGVADTGLLTYARYVKRYGAAPSCKRVIYMLFEGNDVQDTDIELTDIERYQSTGQRSYRQIGPEHSFFKACAQVVSNYRHQPVPHSFQNAWFKTGTTELPVTISEALPPTPSSMNAHEHKALAAGIASCAQEAAALHLKPLIVYVPCNNRLYHGLLRFADNLPKEVKERDAAFGKPTDKTAKSEQEMDLPEWVGNLCAKNQVSFLDATAGLRLAAESGRHLHNRIMDNHFNAEGCKLLADVIADYLKHNP